MAREVLSEMETIPIPGNFPGKTFKYLHSQKPGVFVEHQQILGWRKERGHKRKKRWSGFRAGTDLRCISRAMAFMYNIVGNYRRSFQEGGVEILF